MPILKGAEGHETGTKNQNMGKCARDTFLQSIMQRGMKQGQNHNQEYVPGTRSYKVSCRGAGNRDKITTKKMCQGHVLTKYRHTKGHVVATCPRLIFLCLCTCCGYERHGPRGLRTSRSSNGAFCTNRSHTTKSAIQEQSEKILNVLPKFDLRVIRRSKIVHFIHSLEMRYGQRLAVRLFEQKWKKTKML